MVFIERALRFASIQESSGAAEGDETAGESKDSSTSSSGTQLPSSSGSSSSSSASSSGSSSQGMDLILLRLSQATESHVIDQVIICS